MLSELTQEELSLALDAVASRGDWRHWTAKDRRSMHCGSRRRCD